MRRAAGQQYRISRSEVSGTSYAAAGVTSKVCRILEENSGMTVDKVLKIIDFKGN